MKAQEVYQRLVELAFLAEVLEHPKAAKWTAAAWSIRDLIPELKDLDHQGELAAKKGVGREIAAFVSEWLDGMTPAVWHEMTATVPTSLLDLRKIRGLGPKKIRKLWLELDIATLGELEQACAENRLTLLHGFGEKTQQSVWEQLRDLREHANLRRRDQCQELLELALVAAGLHESDVAITGGYAMGDESSILPLVLLCTRPVASTDDVLFETVPAERLAVETVRRSSEPEFYERLRQHADAKGIDLDVTIASSPEELFSKLELDYTPPERRRAEAPLWHKGKARPKLISLPALRGALHNHTTASDGAASLDAMAAAAATLKLEYLGVSEHSQSAIYARGLSAERLLEQKQMAATSAYACQILHGVESDILEDGQLDYSDDILSQLDHVIASIHSRHAHTREQATARLVRAVSHPATRILGHATGRLVLSRPPIDFDVEVVLAACIAHEVALELNANPRRMDANAAMVARAKEMGVLVCINADAHAPRELANLAHGVALARSAGLCEEDVLNTRCFAEVRDWLQKTRSQSRSHSAG